MSLLFLYSQHYGVLSVVSIRRMTDELMKYRANSKARARNKCLNILRSTVPKLGMPTETCQLLTLPVSFTLLCSHKN